jgi:hypothetical protein
MILVEAHTTPMSAQGCAMQRPRDESVAVLSRLRIFCRALVAFSWRAQRLFIAL